MFSSPFNKWGRETQRLCELAKVTQLGGTTATHCVVLTSGQTHGCKSPLQPLILLGVVPHFSAQNAVETQHRPVTCPLCHTVPFLNRVKSVLRNEVITPSICPTPSVPHPSIGAGARAGEAGVQCWWNPSALEMIVPSPHFPHGKAEAWCGCITELSEQGSGTSTVVFLSLWRCGL